ncbi:Rossmann-like domain-containing protein [Rhodoblastus sp.]|uniref:Rossmann-like domain-containing protein n=1 Tax=Rhodoblastus sp. TaxID=1962975 RepID=UPI0035AEDD9F
MPDSRRLAPSRATSLPPRPAPAPNWLRPGVIVHDPAVIVDRLIVDFAAELRQRGFVVSGYARLGAVAIGAAPQSIDLSTGEKFVETPDSAPAHLAAALKGRADLFAIGRFPACTEAARASGLPVGAGPGRALPLLSAIAGGAIHHWHQFVRQEGSMIAPNGRALWEWWGADRLYDDLVLGVAEAETRRIVCGPRWLMVEGPRGAGLAYLPRLSELSKLSLRDLARFCQSWNPLEAALGVAALNAHYNAYDLEAAAGNGVRGFRSAPGPVVVIGAFPGADSILPDCAIIEADPRPGEYPTAAMETLLPGCGGAIVNSSALINRSLTRILRLARHRAVALIGPSTPLSPRLHDYGVAVLGGFVARDPKGLARAVEAGATPKDFARFGRYIHLRGDSFAPSRR